MRRLPLVVLVVIIVLVKAALWAGIVRWLAERDPRTAVARAQGVDRPVLRWAANRWFNPAIMALGLAGGTCSPWGTILHVGRHSGRTRETPVMPVRLADSLYIPLTYGSGTDWCRNTVVTGGARVRLHGATLVTTRPAILPAAEVLPLLPAPLAAALRITGCRSILRLEVDR
jgi:hypothetical protein